MKVLVIGANGFIARNFIATLENIGAGKDTSYGLTEGLSILKYSRRMGREALHGFCEDCGFAFFLAGVNRPREAEEFTEGNVHFLGDVLEELERQHNKCPVVYASSTQANLDNEYGRSKKAGEDLLLAYSHKTGVPVYIYRLANVFGKWSKPDYNSVVATFCHNIARGLPIRIDMPEKRLRLVYIDDVVDEFVRLLGKGEHENIQNPLYIKNEYEPTLEELAELLYGFRACRDNKGIPDIREKSFAQRLYSMYLTYVPGEQLRYPLNMNRDERGSFTELFRTEERGQFSVNVTKPGITKGEHWHHTKHEKFIVVRGNGLIRLRKIGSPDILDFYVSGEEIEAVDIPPGYTHSITNVGDGDLVTLMWANERFHPGKPDTYSLKVETKEDAQKILWLCNIVLPDFSQEFGIKRNHFGGWMTGMLHGMEKEEGVEVSLCFPIIDKNRLKEGTCKGHDYYTFLYDVDAVTYTDELIQTFEDILEKSRPDLVHIWGTEYPHTTAMLLACQRKGMLERAVVNIQGLVSVYSKHYMAGIPQEYREWETECGISMEEEYRRFEERGKCEVESLKLTRHVIGRTDWDRACAEAINPQVQYHFCNEILRDIFYEYAGCWDYGACQKHAIFVSQASYPIKGFHYLLEALPVVIRKYPDTHVYVAGVNAWDTKEKNPYSQYIIELMERFGLTERISFCGSLDEKQMVCQYLKANVFVLPSTVENSPNSLKEAKLLGVPTVASFVGGVYSEQNIGGDNFFYPYDEPLVLAHYICVLFESRKYPVPYTSKFHNAESCAERNMNIYRSIISKETL